MIRSSLLVEDAEGSTLQQVDIPETGRHRNQNATGSKGQDALVVLINALWRSFKLVFCSEDILTVTLHPGLRFAESFDKCRA